MTKQTQLWILIALLAVANLWLAIRSPSSSRTEYDPHYFAIQDTSEILSIIISQPQDSIVLNRKGTWKLNNEYPADPDIISLFLVLSQRVRVARKIGQSEKLSINSESEKIADVHLLLEDEEAISFSVLSNGTGTRTFFQTDEDYFEVEIPGYTDQVASIFRLTTDQWKDRLVFSGNWRTIQALTLAYQDQPDVNIAFSDSFFEVSGLSAIDSNAVVSFLDLFLDFRANERISPGKIPRFDSLVDETPELIVIIDDIRSKGRDSIVVFPQIEGDRFRLLLDRDGNMAVFEESRIAPIFKKKEDFAY